MSVRVPVAGALVSARLHRGRVVVDDGPCVEAETVLAGLAGEVPRFTSMLAGLNFAARLGLISCEGDLVEVTGRIAGAAPPGTPVEYAVLDALHWTVEPTAAVLAVLALDPSGEVRYQVVKNSATPPGVLARLYVDPVGRVRAKAAEYAKLPIGVVVRNASVVDHPVAVGLIWAAHWRPPSEKAQVLAVLGERLDPRIRAMAEEARQWLEPAPARRSARAVASRARPRTATRP